MSIYGQCQPCSNPADVCKSPRKAHNVTRRIFRRLFPAGHETTTQDCHTYSVLQSENVVLQLTSLCLMSSEGLLLADCRGEEVSLLSFLLSPLLPLLEEGGHT